MKTLNLDSNLIDSEKDKFKSSSKPTGGDNDLRGSDDQSTANSAKTKTESKATKTDTSAISQISDNSSSTSDSTSDSSRSDSSNSTSNNPSSNKDKKGNFLKSIILKYKSLKPIPKVFVTILICGVITGIGGWITYQTIIHTQVHVDLSFPEYVTAKSDESIKFTNIKIPQPDPPRDQPNPINGELYTIKEIKEIQNRYPIAVMVENHIDARNQSGYNSADIVFETLVEGGITRTMPIFWGQPCEEIGPIRSARQYYLEWLMPYDPLYMHIGYAISEDPKVNAAGNIYEYGIKTMNRGATFWRSNKKYSPHNAYTSTELLYEKAAESGYTGQPADIESWKFKRDAAPDSRGNKDKVEITFFERLHNGGTYDVTWKYDSKRNVYLRYQSHNMAPYKDANTDQIVYAKNLIILRTQMISTYDYKAHIIIETIGDGEGIIMRDGHVINMTWKKKDMESRIRFYNEDNEELKLNRGNTWIIAVPIDEGSVTI